MNQNEIKLNKKLLIEANEKLGLGVPKSLQDLNEENDMLSISGKSAFQQQHWFWDLRKVTTPVIWGILPSSCSPIHPSPAQARINRHPWIIYLPSLTHTCEIEESNAEGQHKPHAPKIARPRNEADKDQHDQEEDREFATHSVVYHFIYYSNTILSLKALHTLHLSL